RLDSDPRSASCFYRQVLQDQPLPLNGGLEATGQEPFSKVRGGAARPENPDHGTAGALRLAQHDVDAFFDSGGIEGESHGEAAHTVPGRDTEPDKGIAQ